MRILLCNLLLYFAIRLPGQADSSSDIFWLLIKPVFILRPMVKVKPILLIHGFYLQCRDLEENQSVCRTYQEWIQSRAGRSPWKRSVRDKPHEAKAYASDAVAKDLIALMNI